MALSTSHRLKPGGRCRDPCPDLKSTSVVCSCRSWTLPGNCAFSARYCSLVSPVRTGPLIRRQWRNRVRVDFPAVQIGPHTLTATFNAASQAIQDTTQEIDSDPVSCRFLLKRSQRSNGVRANICWAERRIPRSGARIETRGRPAGARRPHYSHFVDAGGAAGVAAGAGAAAAAGSFGVVSRSLPRKSWMLVRIAPSFAFFRRSTPMKASDIFAV